MQTININDITLSREEIYACINKANERFDKIAKLERDTQTVPRNADYLESLIQEEISSAKFMKKLKCQMETENE